MKQDRRINGWIVAGSIISIIIATVLIAGGAIGILGFFDTEKMSGIKDLDFFVNQKFFADFNLKLEYLYLFLGIAVCLIGVLSLVFGLIVWNYASKLKVVRRKTAIFLFGIYDLIVLASAATYLLLELDSLTRNIKFILYGVLAMYALAWIFKLLGIIFGRSEKFMSHDNNKLAFNGQSRVRPETTEEVSPMPNAQNVNNNEARVQPTMQGQPMPQGSPRPQGAPAPRPAGMPPRPNQMAGQPRPQNSAVPPRPQQPMGTRPMPQGGPRPQGSAVNQARPTQPGMAPRPSQPSVNPNQNIPSSRKYCAKCGKLLNPEERICSLCGFKVSE